MPLQRSVTRLALLTVAPGLVTTLILLYASDAPPALRWTILWTLSFFTLLGVIAIHRRIAHPLRSLATLIEAVRHGDFSLRGRCDDAQDALGEVMQELNALSHVLLEQRLSALEAGVLVDKVMSEVDIAVFAFDSERKLQRVNRAAAEVFQQSARELVGRSALDLGLEPMLEGESGRILPHTFPAVSGRWEIRTRRFRESGRTHELLVISDLSRALREEERRTWKHLVRAMGHEINSSLTPIKTSASTLRTLLDRDPLPEDWTADAKVGLTIIHDRADSLGRFMSAYARLARLPPPTRRRVRFASIVLRVATLYAPHVTLEPADDFELEVDPDQLEQVFINLIKNAIEAMAGAGGVRVRWSVASNRVVAEIEDEGPGLTRIESLWVPFFTTKPGGSGIGLVLSREIVENHGGSLSLENRQGESGCLARICLPL